jgi:methyltransferase (TIGR00027 family)
MQDLIASRTALATSLMRAAHSRLDPNPLIDDPWGDRLVPEPVRELLRARAAAAISPDATVDDYLVASPAYANVIMRTRYTEDALLAAVARGVRQYVLIGAGFDSFALRRPSFAADLDIFEIDHPATQALKTAQIARVGSSLPGSVHFIAADLSLRSVQESLSNSPFRADQPALFSWLGVTMYLTKEANFAALRSIASCGAPGSELAFTYIDVRVMTSTSEEYRELAQTVASMGEPFLCGFDPKTIAEELRACGLTLTEDLNNEQCAARYSRPDFNRGGPSRYSHIALARVGIATGSPP